MSGMLGRDIQVLLLVANSKSKSRLPSVDLDTLEALRTGSSNQR